MLFEPGNFLYMVKQLVTGSNGYLRGTSGARSADGGIKHEVAIPLNAVGTVTTDSNSFPAIEVAGGATAIGTLKFPIPRDYDEASDLFVVRVQLAIASADVAVPITLIGTLSYILPGTNTPVTKTAVTATLPFLTTTALGATQATYEINLSTFGLKRDTLTSTVLALSGLTSAAASIYGVEVLYDSTIVSYNDTDGSGIDGASLAEYGNSLR